MVTILLIVLVVIAIALIGTVLIQRSEGGALGIGGQTGGLISARGSANLLTRATAVLAFLFIAVSLLLGVITGGERRATSVVGGDEAAGGASASAVEEAPAGPLVPEAAGELLVIPDDSTESWNPDASESTPAASGSEVDRAPAVPEAELPPVPPEPAPGAPKAPETGTSPTAPSVPTAD